MLSLQRRKKMLLLILGTFLMVAATLLKDWHLLPNNIFYYNNDNTKSSSIQTMANIHTGWTSSKNNNIPKEATTTSQSIIVTNNDVNETTTTTTTTNSNYTIHIPGWIHNASNVTIVIGKAKTDRMGSQFRQIVNLAAYADCFGYNFCLHPLCGQSYMEEFGMPICPPELDNKGDVIPHSMWHLKFGISEQDRNITEPGVYVFQMRDNQRSKFMVDIIKVYRDQHECPFWTERFQDYWRHKLLGTPTRGSFRNSTTANENLFERNNTTNTTTNNTTTTTTTTIAVHVRRGDITPDRRPDAFVSDETVQDAIRAVRQLILQKKTRQQRRQRGNQKNQPVVEVHLFSEDYGATNWSSYDTLVDYWHLAPQINPDPLRGNLMDWDLNVRDWFHFLRADVLIVGGTFSKVPGSLRQRPNPITGLPLTFVLCSKYRFAQRDQRCGNELFWGASELQTKIRTTDVMKFGNLPPVYAAAVAARKKESRRQRRRKRLKFLNNNNNNTHVVV